MKQKITFYLLLFTVVLFIFQMVNSNKVLRSYEQQWVANQNALSLLQQAKDSLESRLDDEQYFTLEGNTGASTYFEGRDLKQLEQRLMDAIYEMNLKKANNPLIPFEGMSGTFFFNKVKVLNHKWVIAYFSDGTYWGEVLLGYKISEADRIEFKVIDQLLYPQTTGVD
jgi:hypothetical protein